ncbi:hypothetical protein VY88_19750 [Azospirillum thiophilum]|uniref:Uncharacterized protein n=1 Tax=Azospirillum thiophilum TaxID=528244 RepID=A0AAC9EY85_9PROT|nr:DUF2282 domain-containing protein [Azospirillum thiophilum]ALG73944.1 hypothetical protein AL072_23165 [Azospirillum thiophilum]KJR63711.1 hypothetical protein VY88_19750 [Azospirillum thiophilum]
MTATRTKTLALLPVAGALAGALTLLAGPAAAQQANMEKCYGISKAGENGCAHAKGLHSCAGNTSLTYDGGDWKLVKAGTCAAENGQLKPFEGANPKKKA